MGSNYGGKLEKLERQMAEKSFFEFVFGHFIGKLDELAALASRTVISLKSRVDKNKIVFMHYDNRYQCNPKYICNELLRQNKGYDIVFVVRPEIADEFPSPLPKGVRTVKINSLEHFYELATARIWVDNALCCPLSFVLKKRGQVLINTWHGSLGLKKITGVPDPKWRLGAKIAGKTTDYMISNSAFETQVYRSTYWGDPKIKVLEYGHPRSDILFCGEEKKRRLKRKVCRHYGIPEDTSLILYAPTFRNDMSLRYYDLDHAAVLAAAKERFGGEWKILDRYHIKVADKLKKRRPDPDILDGNSYEDIQELMAVCDIGITDYSSWICDYILGSGAGFIYAPDLSKYDKERGFYYPLEETPFPIAENNRDMVKNILTFSKEQYAEKRSSFLEKRGCREDGRAARRVAALINRIMENN
ncbi:CDP-glycerol glycerophosphotransferase family protein [uncultured Ruminococcus sp.]|uniref:CDP-glycerol glycerophosphotransferase family protein n=1 Tax=uncultured Ruminococcus sp. TaxID=165186 RepID=UPI0025DCE63E|nr:CDP-glycerol glycerophosphotransferase family protein [uncultured Ruminococcus sp.]